MKNFNDTQENINWLVKNGYIGFVYLIISTSQLQYQYIANKDFKWLGNPLGQPDYITSSYLYER